MSDTTSHNKRRISWKSVLDVVTSLVMIGTAIFLVSSHLSSRVSSRAELGLPTEPVSIEGAATKGLTTAPVVMITFADFQCPFCARFAREVQPEIERRYVADGRVAVAFRHLPLPIHPQAPHAAAVAECAGKQGEFWEMHDRLFGEAKLDAELLVTIPKSMGLDQRLFDECLMDPSIGQKVTASAGQAAALGVRSTPAFFFGKRLPDGRVLVRSVLSGTRPLEEFARALDTALEDDDLSWLSRLRRIVS
jgi:protein-disulfide isomerase